MINLDMDVVVGHGQNDFEELEMNSGIKVLLELLTSPKLQQALF